MISGRGELLFLHPAFRPAVEELLAEAERQGISVQVTSGHRSIEEQARVCRELAARERREGRRYPCATPGLSAHQWGLAIDAVAGGSLSSPAHARFRALAASMGFAFVADDPPHLEHPAWRGILPHVKKALGY